MAVPTVGSLVAKGGTAAASTNLVLTLTAAANIGDVVFIACSADSGVSVSTIVDSKGNTYVNNRVSGGNNPGLFMIACLVTKALAIADTITITFVTSSQGIAAVAVQLSGVPQNSVINTFTAINSFKGPSSSTAASTNSFTTTLINDTIFLFGVAIDAAAVLLTDFSLGSVNSSYTIIDYVISTGGTTNSGVCLCYKTVSAVNPMPAQNPTFTLNASRTWITSIITLAGLTARAAVGTWLRIGDAASGITNYVPHANDVLGKVPYGQIAKSPFDGAPQPAVTPQEPRVGQQVSDGLLSSE